MSQEGLTPSISHSQGGINHLWSCVPPLPRSTQELRAIAYTDAVRRNQTHPWEPGELDLHSNPVCIVILQKETLQSTASHHETDPAPDELGE